MRSGVLLVVVLLSWICVAMGQTQIVNNGGFEVPNGGEWNLSGAGAVITNGAAAQSGSGFLSMGNVLSANQSAFQTVTFPPNLISAVFGFNFEVVSSDQFANDDVLSLFVLDTNQNVLINVGSVANVNAVSPPSYISVTTNLATYSGQANVSAFAGKSVELFFKVTSDPNFGNQTSFNIDNVTMVIGTTADIPANDNFASSITLATNSNPVTVTATNNFATKESGEPNIAGNPGGHSLWWTWTAPAAGVVTITTAGSSFSTLLGVFTGASLTDLVPVASSNGSLRGTASQVTFGVSPGTRYSIAVDGVNGQSGTINLSLNFGLNKKPPVVAITSPVSGAKITKSTVVVKGTTTDIVDVSLVQYRLENAAGTNDYQPADGTKSWTATVTNLIPGPNTIRVRAFDIGGNVSAGLGRLVNFVVLSPLTVSVSGSGSVVPSLNGHLIGIGLTVSVTARPGPSSIFAGWTGDLTAETAALRFSMQSNMVLQANFIPNPFTPVSGVYQGLFFHTNAVAHESSGFLNATISHAGSYTAKVVLAGANYAIHGQFSATGTASNAIVRRGLPAVAVELQLDLDGGGLAGQLGTSNWTAQLNAFRAEINPPVGNYTLILPASSVQDDSTQPGGDGFGTVRVDKSGRVSFSGTLGDGTPMAQQSIVTPNGQWPFYVALPADTGSIFGWLGFQSDSNSDIGGQLTWFKLAHARPFYPAGFTNQIDAQGSLYQFINGVPVLNFTDGQVVFANGNLAEDFTNQIVLTADSKVTSANGLTLTISKPNGLFRGTVVNPATRKPIAFKGAILEKQNVASGLFLGTNQTGRVSWGP
ncbi:MAG TPA: Ig-like domain-containing protein [Verrucomicrobiae bacterium]|nr:Ig-like domain-containing protein [Verrucomicrobiae bacterium]